MKQDHATPELDIDLDALAANWLLLDARSSVAQCSAVVKANGYGLGDRMVVSALSAVGCRAFYVATLDEAISIAPGLPQGSEVFIFNGLRPWEMEECRRHGFLPVLSTPEQIADWAAANRRESRILPCVIQVDTGMNRLGLELAEWEAVVAGYPSSLLHPRLVMSHLACAEDCHHPLNPEQLASFRQVMKQARRWSPATGGSFANSGGVLLGPDYHFDQVRPGIALYGGNPEEQNRNRFRPVVTLRLPILQLRRVSRDGSVGYGAKRSVQAGSLLATVQGGYADGLLISQSNRGEGEVAGTRVPMVGRISMDLSIFDVSAVAEEQLRENGYIEVLNRNLTIDDMARAASTISYEVLTRLGPRFRKRYRGAVAAAENERGSK